MKAYGEEITLDRIKKAFFKSDLQPIFGKWFQRGKNWCGCCPISILIVTKIGDSEFIQSLQSVSADIAIIRIANEIDESIVTVSSFVSGFDDSMAFISERGPGDKEAYKLGCAVRKELSC